MRRYHRAARPTVRTIQVKYAGACACCGATIKAGEMADYFPIGTIKGVTEARIAHIGGLDGNSARCSAELRRQHDVNAYAGDGLDMRYEDQCSDICGR